MDNETAVPQRTYYLKRMACMGGIWLFACFFLWQALALPPPSRPTPISAATFPRIIGILMLIAATGMLAEAIWGYVRRSGEPEPDDHSNPVVQEEDSASSGPHGEEL